MRATISLYLYQHWLFSILFIIAILLGVNWYLTVVLIGMSLMTNDSEHILTCFLAICRSSLENTEVLLKVIA